MPDSLQIGVGLRSTHFPLIEDFIERGRPDRRVQWFEVISENFMDTQGRPRELLRKIRKHYPVALHGVGLNIGHSDGVSALYLKRLQGLINEIEPVVVSDHLCWSATHAHALHDLLPVPFNSEALDIFCSNIMSVQDFIKRPLTLENVSTYLRFKNSTLPEWEFINEITRRTGCHLLLDLNNVYVNSINHGFSARQYLDRLNLAPVRQIHLAGHSDRGNFLFDTHSTAVPPQVWDLLGQVSPRLTPSLFALLEWDDHIPDWETLVAEAQKTSLHWRPVEAHEFL